MGTYLFLVLEIVFQALRYVMDYCKSWQRILDKDSFSFFCFSCYGFGIRWRMLVLRHLTDIIFFPLSKVLRNIAEWEKKKIYIYIYVYIYMYMYIYIYIYWLAFLTICWYIISLNLLIIHFIFPFLHVLSFKPLPKASDVFLAHWHQILSVLLGAYLDPSIPRIKRNSWVTSGVEK